MSPDLGQLIPGFPETVDGFHSFRVMLFAGRGVTVRLVVDALAVARTLTSAHVPVAGTPDGRDREVRDPAFPCQA
jgi:hypothetical protein